MCMVLRLLFICATRVASRLFTQQSHNNNKHGHKVAQSQNDVEGIEWIQTMYQNTTQERSHDKPTPRLPGSSHPEFLPACRRSDYSLLLPFCLGFRLMCAPFPAPTGDTRRTVFACSPKRTAGISLSIYSYLRRKGCAHLPRAHR